MILLALLALSALVAAPAQQPKASPRQCDSDRWPVKVWADKDAARVDPKPVDTTIRELGDIPIHEVPYPNNRRIEPEELKVYRVKARLVAIKLEKDSDLHLLLVDPQDDKARMIAEAPAPECAEGSGHEELFRKVREQVVFRDLVLQAKVVEERLRAWLLTHHRGVPPARLLSTHHAPHKHKNSASEPSFSTLSTHSQQLGQRHPGRVVRFSNPSTVHP